MRPPSVEGKTPPNVFQLGGAAGFSPTGEAANARESGGAIHDHELVRRIGRGAYGEVWLARNALGTCRAIKIVYRKDFEDSRPFEREFAGIQKFEPISRSYPGLVNILQVGRREDYFYYVMELADAAEDPKAETRNPKEGRNPKPESGAANDEARDAPRAFPSVHSPQSSDLYRPRTLREDLRQNGRLPAGRCVEIGLALTSALAHLHRHGLVHRDVKPSNIIFVQGAPKLADIGLVTEAGDSRSIVGTEGYLPPEGPGTPQADIFSLGKVLYEISTGQDRRQFPDLPPGLKGWPDHDLALEVNEVVLRSCAHDLSSRYQHAEDMFGELAGLQQGRSVKGRRAWQHHLNITRQAGVAAATIVAAGVAAVFSGRRSAITAPRYFHPGTKPASVAPGIPELAEAPQRGMLGLRRGTLEGFRQALADFTAAAEADPKFVAAQARLFEIYLMSEDYDVAEINGKAGQLTKLSAKLVQLDPTNAETHAAVAIVHFLNEWRWAEAEDEFKEALKADPNCRMALTYYGYFLTRLRRASEARPVLERALQIDPRLAPDYQVPWPLRVRVQRHYDKALRLYQRASELEPAYPGGHYWAGRVNLALGNYAQARDELDETDLKWSLDLSATKEDQRKLRQALDKGGPPAYWRKCLEDINDSKMQSPYWYAECHARLGDRVEALAGLQEAVKQRDTVENLLVDEFWAGYRDEPKFRDALKKVGLDRWEHRERMPGVGKLRT